MTKAQKESVKLLRDRSRKREKYWKSAAYREKILARRREEYVRNTAKAARIVKPISEAIRSGKVSLNLVVKQLKSQTSARAVSRERI